MVSFLLLISCALCCNEYFKHFTLHFQDCQISLPTFPCHSVTKVSILPAKGTGLLSLGARKSGKRTLLHLKLPCADAAMQQLLISFQSPQEISPRR